MKYYRLAINLSDENEMNYPNGLLGNIGILYLKSGMNEEAEEWLKRCID